MTRWIAVFALAGATLFGQAKQESPVKQLTDDEVREAVEKKQVFLLDVRDPKELETLGTVKGYVNIPLNQLEARLKEVPKDKLILTL